MDLLHASWPMHQIGALGPCATRSSSIGGTRNFRKQTTWQPFGQACETFSLCPAIWLCTVNRSRHQEFQNHKNKCYKAILLYEPYLTCSYNMGKILIKALHVWLKAKVFKPPLVSVLPDVSCKVPSMPSSLVDKSDDFHCLRQTKPRNAAAKSIGAESWFKFATEICNRFTCRTRLANRFHLGYDSLWWLFSMSILNE